MSESDRGQNLAPHRKPMVSTVVNRKRVAKTLRDDTMLSKKSDIVVKRVAPKQTMKEIAEQPAQRQVIKNIEEPVRPTAKQMKDEAIKKALAASAKKSPKKVQKIHVHFGFKRVLLALMCSSVAVFAIVYFVNLNAPDISLKVAAMQTGIDAAYPAYKPRGYNISDITSENGKITLNYKNEEGDAYSLVEEKSSWDSNALLNNYVRSEYGDNYLMMKEQGLTIYISGSNAAWVNGGIVYKLKTTSGSLTKKQITTIAINCR